MGCRLLYDVSGENRSNIPGKGAPVSHRQFFKEKELDTFRSQHINQVEKLCWPSKGETGMPQISFWIILRTNISCPSRFNHSTCPFSTWALSTLFLIVLSFNCYPISIVLVGLMSFVCSYSHPFAPAVSSAWNYLLSCSHEDSSSSVTHRKPLLKFLDKINYSCIWLPLHFYTMPI